MGLVVLSMALTVRFPKWWFELQVGFSLLLVALLFGFFQWSLAREERKPQAKPHRAAGWPPVIGEE